MSLLFRYFLVAISLSLFILIDWLSVKWFESGNLIYIPLLSILGLTAYWLFGWVSNMTSLSITSGLINTGIVIGTILVGIFIRNDVLDFQQKTGLFTAIIAIALLTIHVP